MTRGPHGRLLKLVLALLLADLFFFSLVNPATGNSLLVIAGSFLLGLTLYVLLRASIRLVAYAAGLTDATQKRLAVFAAALLMFVLLMQSVGQLSTRDVLAAVILMVVLYVYLSYISDGASNARAKQTRE